MPLPVQFQGTVKPYSFVTLADPANPTVVRQAGPNDPIVGVAPQHPAPAGKGGEVLGESDGRVSLILSPNVGRRVRRGEYLKAGADGYGVPAALGTPDDPSEDYVGAWVHEGGEPGTRLVVEVFLAGPTE